jgi:ABC-type branched-subunit amino acid transport system substrate-binding protein
MGQPVRARSLLLALALGLATASGACQSSSGTDALEGVEAPDAATKAAPAPAVAEQSYGTGPARIDLFIDGSVAYVAGDYRDGAALAVKELGAGQLTLTVHDLRAAAADPAAKVKQATDGGARLLIGPPSFAAALRGAGAKGGTRGAPAAVLLASEPAPGTMAIASDEIAAAVEVAAYASGAGMKKIMVVSTRAIGPEERKRLDAGMKKGGVELLDVVTDPTSADGAAKLARLGEAQAVLLLGADAPKVAGPALRQRGGLDPGVPFLGTFAWPGESYGERALEGSLVALVDQEALKRIAQRFQAAYRRPLSLEAAYGFDVVAVAAGIARAKGAEGLDAAALRAASGFAGATGVFRFGADGRAERRLAIYRLAGGKPVLQDAAPSGF